MRGADADDDHDVAARGTLVLLHDVGSERLPHARDDAREACRRLARFGAHVDVTERCAAPGTLATVLAEAFEDATRSGSSFAVVVDADGHRAPEHIVELVQAHLVRRPGMTIGARGRFTDAVENVLVRSVTPLRGVQDAASPFRVLDLGVVPFAEVERLGTDRRGVFVSLTVLVQVHGFTVDELSCAAPPRSFDTPAQPARSVTAFLADLVAARRRARAIRQEHWRDQTDWAQRALRFNNQESAGHASYGAMPELEMLASATRYFDWIVDEFRPHLRGDVLEVGAGIGTVTRRLAAACPGSRIVALEPADEPFEKLRHAVADLPMVEARHEASTALIDRADRAFDTAVYINVLEHIEDDVDELRRVAGVLRPGGTVCAFVPAVPHAYGSMDYVSGHYRRYSKRAARDVFAEAGYRVESVRYFDVAGLAPYWLAYRVLDWHHLGGGSSRLFDDVIVPASKAFQRVVRRPPIGKNVLVVARVA